MHKLLHKNRQESFLWWSISMGCKSSKQFFSRNTFINNSDCLETQMNYLFYFSSSSGDDNGPRIHRFNPQDAGTSTERTPNAGIVAKNNKEHGKPQSKTYSLVTGCDFLGDAIMATAEQGRASFNDFKFYQRLCHTTGCNNVTISSIRVRHNRFCHGLQVEYRSKFSDGSTRLAWAEPHFYQRGYYAYAGERRSQEETWVLGEEEHIRGLRIRQGEIMDGITFVTNQRELHTGGYGGSPRNMMLSVQSNHRIVAFTGTEYGVLQRIGYYAKPFGWSIVRPYIMLRWLKINGRALVIDGEEESIINNFMNLAEDGIFRTVLEYLVLYK